MHTRSPHLALKWSCLQTGRQLPIKSRQQRYKNNFEQRISKSCKGEFQVAECNYPFGTQPDTHNSEPCICCQSKQHHIPTICSGRTASQAAHRLSTVVYFQDGYSKPCCLERKKSQQKNQKSIRQCDKHSVTLKSRADPFSHIRDVKIYLAHQPSCKQLQPSGFPSNLPPRQLLYVDSPWGTSHVADSSSRWVLSPPCSYLPKSLL